MGPGSPALPIARHIHLLATWNFLLFGVMMVLFATVRANGAVWAPLIILAVGLVPVRFGYIFVTYHWLRCGRDLDELPGRPRCINLALAVGLLFAGRMEEGAHVDRGSARTTMKCTEEALATREPGGALIPQGDGARGRAL